MRQLKIEKQVTNRETVSLDKYLHEISKYKLVIAEEEVELANRIKKGDLGALEQLIKANLRFVVSAAKQYQNQGLSLPDLINEGNSGVIKAAHRFDETRGFKFISYAVWWIRQSILQALAEKARIVRLPLNQIGAIKKIYKSFCQLEQEYQREPTNDEIALLIKQSPRTVEETLNINIFSISLDAPIHGEEENSLYDIILNKESLDPDMNLLNLSLCREIERTLMTLDEREAKVIRYYFGLSGQQQCSLDEIANEFGMTRERVRQIKEKAIKKLRNHYRTKLLKKYL